MLKVALALLGAVSLLLVPGGFDAQAAPTGLNTTQSCNSSGTADITFNWRGVGSNSRQVWIDLTTGNNWRAGTYISAGPFSASDTAYVWAGIKPNQTHYYRLTEQLANGSWVASVTSSFSAVCGNQNSSATPEEQSYRNRATAQITALSNRLKQTPRASRVNLIATLDDFVAVLDNLEPVPPRFRDVHYQLRDSLVNFTSCARTTSCSRDELEELLDELGDALDDYDLVVGI